MLDDVKKWMTFFGWKNGGNPGDVKHDADGKVIATHGTNEWIKDVQDACERIERAKLIEELQRREPSDV